MEFRQAGSDGQAAASCRCWGLDMFQTGTGIRTARILCHPSSASFPRKREPRAPLKDHVAYLDSRFRGNDGIALCNLELRREITSFITKVESGQFSDLKRFQNGSVVARKCPIWASRSKLPLRAE